jgi:hypothetical protein
MPRKQIQQYLRVSVQEILDAFFQDTEVEDADVKEISFDSGSREAVLRVDNYFVDLTTEIPKVKPPAPESDPPAPQPDSTTEAPKEGEEPVAEGGGV